MNIFKKKSYFSVSGTEEKKKTEKNKKLPCKRQFFLL